MVVYFPWLVDWLRLINWHLIYFLLQLLLKTGAEGKQTVFLFADNQIKDESFMEDISMILNTGDVPNLYAADEKAEIIEKMQTVARNEVQRCSRIISLQHKHN